MTQTTITQPGTTLTEDQEYEISRVDFSCNGIDFQFLTDENGAVHIFGNRTDADCWVWFTVSSCDSLEAAKDYAKYWAEAAPFKPYKGCYMRVWRVAECWICDLIGIDEDLYCAMADTKEDGIRQLKVIAEMNNMQ